MSNTPGTGTAGIDTDGGAPEGFDLNDAIGNAYDEITTGDPAHWDVADVGTEGVSDTGVAPASEQNAAETPAAGAAQAPATPDQWSAQEQAAFDALPPQTKSLVEKRIAHAEATFTEKNKQSLEMADGLRAIVDKTGARAVFEQSGMNEVQGVEYLANLEKFAREKPADYLRFVAQHVQERFGLNPAEILGLGAPAQPGAGTADDGFGDPRVDKLIERLDVQERRNAEAVQRRVYESAGQQVAEFASAKDAAGNLLHPHLSTVEGDMARLMNADQKMTLKEAYEAAVWSNPTVRAELQKAERESALKQQRDEANAARRAARGNVRGGGRSMEASPEIKTSDDAVNAAMDKLGL